MVKKETKGVGAFAPKKVAIQPAASKPVAAAGRIGNLGAFAHAPKKKSSRKA
jgi:hypothetical protein